MGILLKEKALQKAQSYARYASTHPSYLEWRKSYIESEGLYDGTNQWLKDDIETLRKRNEAPITLNVVAGIIDSQCGIETQSRYRCVVDVDDNREDYRALSRALTKHLLNFQENNDLPAQGSLKFRDTCIGGLGWSNIYFENGRIWYLREDPLNVIPDFDDTSPQFTNMRFVTKIHWLSKQDIKEKFGVKIKGLNLEELDLGTNFFSGELAYRECAVPPAFLTSSASKVPVWEVQFKNATSAYCGLTKGGRFFNTFDIEKAEKIANSQKDIEEFRASQILRLVFFEDRVLHYAPLPSSSPLQKDFSLIPLVWKKRSSDNVPYGIAPFLRTPQIEINARITKGINSINSNKTFITGVLPEGIDRDEIKKELMEKNSVVFIPGSDAQIKFENGIVLGEENIKVVQFYIDMMKRISGIHDEVMGAKSNATSGIAERLRQDSSIRNSAFAFSNFEFMKKREAKQYVYLLQNSFLENIEVLGASEEDNNPVILNLTAENFNGEQVIYNDISFLPFNLYIDEVANFRSNKQYQKEEMVALLSNPHADIIMMSPKFLEKFTNDSQEIAEEFKMAMMQKAQIMASQKQEQPQAATTQVEANTIPSTIGG